MHVRRFTNAREFLPLTEPMLLRDEAPNCFFLGSVPQLSEFELLCAICDGGEPIAAAVMTPGYHLFMSSAPRRALDVLIDYLIAERISPPGVQSDTDTAKYFSRNWCARTKQVEGNVSGMGVYRLTRLIPPPAVSGTLRIANENDIELVQQWVEQFGIDIREPRGYPAISARERIAEGRIFVWDDGQPVSMAAWAGPTPNGVRINLVYTPRELRRRGYASAAVAALTRRMLDGGKKFCFLYTDLANPTSNKIYRAIGYEHVRDDARIMFTRDG
jgi:GNAT superfamily N-acetyltransferase